MTMFFAKKLNKKGFTLAELLIVVAIIAVLIAIAVPIYTGNLKRARIGVHSANARSLKAMGVMAILNDAGFADNATVNDLYTINGQYVFATEEFTITSITVAKTGTVSTAKVQSDASGAPSSAKPVDDSGDVPTTGTATYVVQVAGSDVSAGAMTWS